MERLVLNSKFVGRNMPFVLIQWNCFSLNSSAPQTLKFNCVWINVFEWFFFFPPKSNMKNWREPFHGLFPHVLSNLSTYQKVAWKRTLCASWKEEISQHISKAEQEVIQSSQWQNGCHMNWQVLQKNYFSKLNWGRKTN